jgi:zinc protease
VNLRLTEKEVLTERDVILEERRSRVDNNPGALLDEQMNAVLHQSHPYKIPVIGWEHEMAKLSPQDAMAFYKRNYAPNNAILIVAGDVTPGEVKRLAEETYGKIPFNPAVSSERHRPMDPPARAARRVTLEDPRAGRPSLMRYYQVPSYATAKPGEAEAMDLLMKVTAQGSLSRLYKRLVVDKKLASSVSGDYSGSPMDYGTLSIHAVAADGVPLQDIEAEIDSVLAEIKEKGVSEPELERAKNGFIADYVYESDNQMNMARRYGWSLVVGRTIAQVEGWPDAIAKVTADEVSAAGRTYFDPKRSVTGMLVPTPDAGPRAEAASPSAVQNLR